MVFNTKNITASSVAKLCNNIAKLDTTNLEEVKKVARKIVLVEAKMAEIDSEYSTPNVDFVDCLADELCNAKWLVLEFVKSMGVELLNYECRTLA